MGLTPFLGMCFAGLCIKGVSGGPPPTVSSCHSPAVLESPPGAQVPAQLGSGSGSLCDLGPMRPWAGERRLVLPTQLMQPWLQALTWRPENPGHSICRGPGPGGEKQKETGVGRWGPHTRPESRVEAGSCSRTSQVVSAEDIPYPAPWDLMSRPCMALSCEAHRGHPSLQM